MIAKGLCLPQTRACAEACNGRWQSLRTCAPKPQVEFFSAAHAWAKPFQQFDKLMILLGLCLGFFPHPHSGVVRS